MVDTVLAGPIQDVTLLIGLSYVIQAVMQTDRVTTNPDCPTVSIHQAHLLKHKPFGRSVSLYCHYCINLPQEVTRKHLDRILLLISDDRLCGCNSTCSV